MNTQKNSQKIMQIKPKRGIGKSYTAFWNGAGFFPGRSIIIMVCAIFLKSSADDPLPVIGLFSVLIAMPWTAFFSNVHENESIVQLFVLFVDSKLANRSFMYRFTAAGFHHLLPCDTISGTSTPEITN